MTEVGWIGAEHPDAQFALPFLVTFFTTFFALPWFGLGMVGIAA